MGSILWFALAFFAYALIYKVSGGAEVQQKIYLFMLLPPVLGYGLIPLWASIREKIYYKFYELGNNGLYIPTYTQAEEETQTEDTTTSSDDINIEN